jgi:type I restriction enzyme M protein
MDEKSFSSDSQLNDALENLLEKMDLEMDSNDFVGEYEPLNDSEYLFLINLINCLKDDGVMVVSISQSFLFKNSLELLRKYLVYEHNYLDTVISIPEGLGRTTRPEVICVFRKNRINDDILFVDLTKNFKTKKAQHIAPGAIRRNLSLSNDTFNQLLRVYDRREIIERYSNVVSIREVAQNEFNLSVSRYVDTFEGEFIQLKDLANEKKEITSQIKELNKKIDEMMEELDLRF